jgi:hypothetical protein
MTDMPIYTSNASAKHPLEPDDESLFMPYSKTIVCLANSFKNSGRCVAGRELLENGVLGPWVRPVSHRPTTELQLWECIYPDNGIPKLLDIIDVPLINPVPRNHQTENHLIDGTREWIKRGQFGWQRMPQLEENPSTLWINSTRTSAGSFNCISQDEAATQGNSLFLIKCRGVSISITNTVREAQPVRNHFASFRFNGVYYALKLTDLAVIDRLKSKPLGSYSLSDVYLCVSLTEPFEKDNNRCHKIVAAIFRNPPP